MNAERIRVEEKKDGEWIRITVPDDSTDTLIILDIHNLRDSRPERIAVSAMVRGNCSGGRYPDMPARRPVRSNLLYEAPTITAGELQRRRAIVYRAEGIAVPEPPEGSIE